MEADDPDALADGLLELWRNPERAAALLSHVWTATVRPYWERRRRILEADVVARTAQVSRGGWAAVIDSLLPGQTRWLGDNRLRYRLLLRPQATARPDQARIAVEAPPGWRFTGLPSKARVTGSEAAWAGSFDRERELVFDLARR